MPAVMKRFAQLLDTEYYLPEHCISNEALARHFHTTPEAIFRSSGVQHRYAVQADQLPSDIALLAAEKLLQRQPSLRKEIDFLFFCTQTFDYASPSTACLLQDQLGLSKHCGATDIGLGCSGFLYCLSLAKAMIESGQCRKVLILTAETLTRYLDPDNKATRCLFGDGASATLVGTAQDHIKHLGSFAFGTDGSGASLMHYRSGGFRHLNLRSNAYPKDADIRYFRMDGTGVFEWTLAHIPAFVQKVLRRNRQSPDFSGIDKIIFHQSSKVVLKALQKKLKIPEEKILYSLDCFGNTVSSSVPMTYALHLQQGHIRKDERVLLVAFGVGLSCCGTVLRV